MSSFQVALEELQRIHGHIHQIAEELKNAKADDDGIHNHTGYGKVEATIHHFFNEWSQGMNATVKNLQGLGSVLTQAENAYRSAESKITICAGGGG